MKTTIATNLRKAIEIIKAKEPEEVNLFMFKNHCGTVACAAGWIASDSYFNDLGLRLVSNPSHDGQPFILVSDNYRHDDGSYILWGYPHYPHSAEDDSYAYLNPIFGEEAFDRLFAERGYGFYDSEFLSVEDHAGTVGDKELAIARLERQLALYV